MLLSVPAILVCGLCERQSNSTSVANAAAQTLRHLGPIFILRCGPLGTMTYSYLIVYRAETMPLQIVSILHGRRDVEQLLRDRL